MTTLSSLAISSLVLTAAACGEVVQHDEGADVDLRAEVTLDSTQLEQGGPPPEVIARSCADLRTQMPSAEDGEYTLYVHGDVAYPFTAWCQDMASTPLDYLRLENVMGDANFAQYSRGGSALGTDVRTYYLYLRLDPETLVIDTSDQRFTSSEGSLSHPGGITVTSMPYGVAMGCSSSFAGRANIDLRGTHFAVTDTFQFAGANSFGVIVSDPGMTRIDISGGGLCGWMAPTTTAFNPFNAAGGTLQLAYVP